MNAFFYIAAFMAILTTVLAITRNNAIHALLYTILSLLSISVMFYLLGAPFVAALEVIIYAGAIMVLFIFVIMMLNVGIEKDMEKKWKKPRMWILPSIIACCLLVILIYSTKKFRTGLSGEEIISPGQVGYSLFTTYLIGVEIVGVLLLAGIIGAYHLGKQRKKVVHRFLENRKN